ncbi:MAG TPA: hypothetical protein ENN99_13380 [Chloroflexi bacterium]|nr:hypothetical protein [Chloroflexota bacterium]
MCDCEKYACTHPDKKMDPQACTPEQILECHGPDAVEHPCAIPINPQACTPEQIRKCHGANARVPLRELGRSVACTRGRGDQVHPLTWIGINT